MGICNNLFENLTFGFTERKTVVKHVCPKCGYVDESPVEVTKLGLNFTKPPGTVTGVSGLCPWTPRSKQ